MAKDDAESHRPRVRGDNRHAADVLNRFMSQFHIEGAEEHIGFYSSWQEIAGINLSAHSKPVDIRNGSIVVEVDHPGWMQRLQMEKDRILREVSRRFPQLEVKNIYIRVVEATDRREVAPEARSGRRSAIGAELDRDETDDADAGSDDVDPAVKERFDALKKALRERGTGD